jgi:hypothetical protein
VIRLFSAKKLSNIKLISMTKRTTRGWNSRLLLDNSLGKRRRTSINKALKRQNIEALSAREVCFNPSNDAANYDSDFGSTGVYTPFSNYSYASKSTTFTTMSRRVKKGSGK